MSLKVGLVQINAAFSSQRYLPYSIGGLVAYAKKFLKNPDEYEYLLPVFDRMPVRDAVTELVNADVVAFSVYVWNEQLSLEIAKCLKQLKPSIIILFGGPQIPDPFDETKPHIPNRAKAYLEEHPFIDILCHGEGEVAFVYFLENCFGDWKKIPSASFVKEGTFYQTIRAERIRNLGIVPSPYTEGTFAPLMAAYPDMKWIGSFETDRGCPYFCTFCGWGSLVGQKVNQFPQERVFQELEWFGKNEIEFVFCCNANFGIFPRDIEIARYAAEVKKTHGFPHILSVQSAKNVTDRVWEVHTILHGMGMEKAVILALQSADSDTLNAIKRKNIKREFYRELHVRAKRAGIPTSTDLILPLPGETFTSFVDGICEVIEDGGAIQVNPLSIEPDAEMSDPAYQEKFGIVSVRARVVNVHGAVAGEGIFRTRIKDIPRGELSLEEWAMVSIEETREGLFEEQKLVIATTSMPKVDWVRAKTFSWTVLLLYFNRLLTIPLIVLRNNFGIEYQKMLTLFSDSSSDWDEYPVISWVQSVFREKAREIQNGGYEYCAFNGIWWPANEYVFIQLCVENKLAGFYQEAEKILSVFLLDSAIDIPEGLLHEAILLNQGMLKLPSQKTDLDITLSYNIGEFYKSILEMQPILLEKKSSSYHINRTSKIWDFDRWCEEVVWWCHKGSRYLYEDIGCLDNKPSDEIAGHY